MEPTDRIRTDHSEQSVEETVISIYQLNLSVRLPDTYPKEEAEYESKHRFLDELAKYVTVAKSIMTTPGRGDSVWTAKIYLPYIKDRVVKDLQAAVQRLEEQKDVAWTIISQNELLLNKVVNELLWHRLPWYKRWFTKKPEEGQ